MERLLDTTRPRLLLTLFCLLLWAPGFFTLPPGDRDESRFTQATKQMLETGDYVRIMNGTEPRNRKPIGIHWLQAPFVAAIGAAIGPVANPVWPYRIPSALGGLVAVLATFGLGEALFGRRTALLGAAMLAASVILAVEVHIAKTDAALLGATTVAMGVMARAYMGLSVRWWVFWVAMGVGVLLKGPITPMVAGLAAGALVLADRRAAWLRALRPGWGVLLMLAIVLPWFVAIGLATEGQFFADAVGKDLGRKLSSGDDAHGGPPGLHLLLLPLLLFPATLALPSAVMGAWRGRADPAVRFLLAWIIPAWIIFEATPTKLPHYPLPLYPALCLLLAGAVLAGVRYRRVGMALAGLAAVVIAGGAVALPFVVHGTPAIPALVTAVLVGVLAVRAWTARGMVLALAASVLMYAGVLELELPRLPQLWLAPRVVALLPPGAVLGSVGFSEPSLMMLAGTRTEWLLAADGARALASGDIGALLVGDRDMAAFEAEAARIGLLTRRIGQVPGFNVSRGRAVVLTLFSRQG